MGVIEIWRLQLRLRSKVILDVYVFSIFMGALKKPEFIVDGFKRFDIEQGKLGKTNTLRY